MHQLHIRQQLKEIENLPSLAHCSKSVIQPRHYKSKLYLRKELEPIYGGIFYSGTTARDTWTEEKLSQYDITHIVYISHMNHHNSQMVPYTNGRHKLEQLHLNISNSRPAFKELLRGLIFIHNAFKCQAVDSTILILDSTGYEYCFMFVTAYIMNLHNYTFFHAYRLIRSIHPHLEINSYIANILQEYEIRGRDYLYFEHQVSDCMSLKIHKPELIFRIKNCHFHVTMNIKNLEESEEPIKKKHRIF